MAANVSLCQVLYTLVSSLTYPLPSRDFIGAYVLLLGFSRYPFPYRIEAESPCTGGIRIRLIILEAPPEALG